MEQTRRNNSAGFTLMEVALAVAVLSLALVTILGLQTASIHRAVLDRNRQEAMLIARQIFAAAEAKTALSGPMAPGDKVGPPDEVINSIIAGTADAQAPLDPDNRYIAALSITSWPIPVEGVPEDAVQRIHLSVSWGNTRDERLEVDYFLPAI